MVARFQQIYRVHQIYRGFIAALSWDPLRTMPVQGKCAIWEPWHGCQRRSNKKGA